MTKFLLSISLFVLSLNALAMTGSSHELECSVKTQGVDYFPWGSASPFPWGKIQGVWMVQTEDSKKPIYLKARVSITLSNIKLLNLTIVQEGNCAQPIAEGTGYVNYKEPNVIRAMVNDGNFKYQMRLAQFESKYLSMNSELCGESIMAASIKILGHSSPRFTEKENEVRLGDDGDAIQNVMLKKVSNNLNSICKKPISF